MSYVGGSDHCALVINRYLLINDSKGNSVLKEQKISESFAKKASKATKKKNPKNFSISPLTKDSQFPLNQAPAEHFAQMQLNLSFTESLNSESVFQRCNLSFLSTILKHRKSQKICESTKADEEKLLRYKSITLLIDLPYFFVRFFAVHQLIPDNS